MGPQAARSLTELKPGERCHNMGHMSRALVDRYRCPEEFVHSDLAGPLSMDSGYFSFGQDAICYGRTSGGYRSPDAKSVLYDATSDVGTVASELRLVFDPSEVIDNLRLERYVPKPTQWSGTQRFLRDAYYFLRPLLPTSVRKYVKRFHSKGWQHIVFPHWPVDVTVEQLSENLLLEMMRARGIQKIPFIWFWPRGATSCVVMTHDVEEQQGHDFCRDLMDIDEAHGIKASFQLVPERRYKIAEDLLAQMRGRGFEVNVQDLDHDGYLFANREEFLRRVNKINHYGRMYGAKGFRAAVLYRNSEWFDALGFSYDMSLPNVAHLDPQRGGCCTVFPYFIGEILEIPLTTIQDYMLFYVLGDYSVELWKKQVDLILQHNGLISFLMHPDYLIEKHARGIYRDFLAWLRKLSFQEKMWFALPGEVDTWWRARSQMSLVRLAGGWRIEGRGAERAALAYARDRGDHIEYEVPGLDDTRTCQSNTLHLV